MQIQTLLNVSNENASFIKQKKKYFLKESNEVMGKWSLFPEQISALNSVLWNLKLLLQHMQAFMNSTSKLFLVEKPKNNASIIP